ncbi:MAG: cytochrome c biogenesis protein CcsA [Desulfobulbaceae bacterium]|nr:cytochrome c biogenesis protein CcsA [Desulfobulbaceae bacterium]
MLHVEFILYWLAAAFYGAAAIIFITTTFLALLARKNIGVVLSCCGLVFHGAALVLRWYLSGHGPYLDTFEVISSDVWMIVGLFIFCVLRTPRVQFTGVIVLPSALLLLGFAVMSSPEIKRLPATFSTYWLIVHILFAKLTLASLLIAVASSLTYLLKKHRGENCLASAPSPEKLDRYAAQYCGMAFSFWSITIIAGAIWAQKSWGRYWAWDPIELWSLTTWLLLGLYYHLRRFHGLRGRYAAYCILLCFFVLATTGYIIPLAAKTIHTEYLQ